MPAKFYSGKNSRSIIGSATVAGNNWTIKNHGDLLDTRNFESNGFGEVILGFQQADWSVAGNWDGNRNPNQNPPGLYPRDDGTTMQLFIANAASGNKFWSLPTWACQAGDNAVTATGLVTFAGNGQSIGTYNKP